MIQFEPEEMFTIAELDDLIEKFNTDIFTQEHIDNAANMLVREKFEHPLLMGILEVDRETGGRLEAKEFGRIVARIKSHLALIDRMRHKFIIIRAKLIEHGEE